MKRILALIIIVSVVALLTSCTTDVTAKVTDKYITHKYFTGTPIYWAKGTYEGERVIARCLNKKVYDKLKVGELNHIEYEYDKNIIWSVK